MKGLLSVMTAVAGLRSVLGQGLEASLVVNPKNSPGVGGSTASLPIDISALRNNRGFGTSPNDADFDGTGASYPAKFLPAENFTYGGVDFIFPQYQDNNGSDNVLAQGQVLNVTRGRYIGVHMLAAAESAIATGFVNATYADASTTSGAVLVDPFWAWPYPYGGDIIFPYHLTNQTVDCQYNPSPAAVAHPCSIGIFRMHGFRLCTRRLTHIRQPLHDISKRKLA